ncbi:MAG: B12-binding domain-containing radical SAM protein [Leptospirillia bacterium]
MPPPTKKLKILMIQPTLMRLSGVPVQAKKRLIMTMVTPYLAGLTPLTDDIVVIDDKVQQIPYEGDFDLVAITTTTGSANRAYDISRKFRERKIPVVMGGFHSTLHPADTLLHADSVVVGEAENVWGELLNDCRRGSIKSLYKADQPSDMKSLPRPRYELLDLSRYRIHMMPIQATRGCNYHCDFCEVPVVYDGAYRMRPVEDIVEEILQQKKIMGINQFQFIDDQLTGKHAFARELFKALKPLDIKWSCLWTLNTNHDEELLDLAIDAGCIHVNIGMESINQENLNDIHKKQNHVKDYIDLLKAMEKRRLFYSLNLMFGLDHDTPDVFPATLDFLEKVRAPLAFFSIVSPREGTPLRARLNAENRVVDPTADQYSSGHVCMFVPKNMTKEQVEKGIDWVQRSFYSPRSIVKRLLYPKSPFTFHRDGLPSNLFFHYVSRKGIDTVEYY